MALDGRCASRSGRWTRVSSRRRAYARSAALGRINARIDDGIRFERHNTRGKDRMTARVALALAVMTALALGSIRTRAYDRMHNGASAACAGRLVRRTTPERSHPGGAALASTSGNTAKPSLGRRKTAFVVCASHSRRLRSAKPTYPADTGVKIRSFKPPKTPQRKNL